MARRGIESSDKMNISIKTSIERENYNALDVAKFVSAILIITIHVLPFGNKYTIDTGTWQGYANYFIKQYLARIAVPFFFICSGFFLYKKTIYEDFSFEPTKKYALRLFKLYLIWSAIYLPINISEYIGKAVGLKAAIIDYLGDFIFAGSYFHLWYLPATIFAVLLISCLLYRKISVKKILIFAAIFYLIGLLEQSYFGLIRPLKNITPGLFSFSEEVLKIIRSTRNGLFDGFIFVGIGMLFAYYEIRISRKKAFLGFALSMIFLFLEVCILTHFEMIRKYDMYFFLIPCAFFLFAWLSKVKLLDKVLYKTLRKMSSLVFYGHLIFRFILKKIFKAFSIDYAQNASLFLFTVAFSMLGSLVIIKLSEKKYFRWLKILY